MNATTDARMAAFNAMSPAQQRTAIREMFDYGYSARTIAAATGLDVLMVLRVLTAHGKEGA